jgi:hypothetical protein
VIEPSGFVRTAAKQVQANIAFLLQLRDRLRQGVMLTD